MLGQRLTLVITAQAAITVSVVGRVAQVASLAMMVVSAVEVIKMK